MKTIKRSFKLLGLLFFLLASCQSESDFSDAPVDALASNKVGQFNLKMITGIR